jgi:hypothetical protein
MIALSPTTPFRLSRRRANEYGVEEIVNDVRSHVSNSFLYC